MPHELHAAETECANKSAFLEIPALWRESRGNVDEKQRGKRCRPRELSVRIRIVAGAMGAAEPATIA